MIVIGFKFGLFFKSVPSAQNIVLGLAVFHTLDLANFFNE